MNQVNNNMFDDNIWNKIISNLGIVDICKIRTACKNFKTIINTIPAYKIYTNLVNCLYNLLSDYNENKYYNIHLSGNHEGLYLSKKIIYWYSSHDFYNKLNSKIIIKIAIEMMANSSYHLRIWFYGQKSGHAFAPDYKIVCDDHKLF